jgi:hypothetical protein
MQSLGKSGRGWVLSPGRLGWMFSLFAELIGLAIFAEAIVADFFAEAIVELLSPRQL